MQCYTYVIGGILMSESKRTLLGDLGPDWLAPFVSLVDGPAVPKALFYVVKRKDGTPLHTMSLKSARMKAGLSQAALSVISGVDQGLISRVESGARKLSSEVAVKLAPHVSAKADDLVTSSLLDSIRSRTAAWGDLEPEDVLATAERR